MIIRHASISDFDAVYSLICDLEETRFAKTEFKKVYDSNLKDDRVGYFVVDISGNIAAFCSIHINALLHHCGNVGEIQEFIVSSDYSNRGIGRELIQFADTWSKEKGLLHLEVTCNSKRLSAHTFYKKMGFEETHKKFIYKYL